jgi:uncharacterized protein YabE (DUF348 family)
MGDGVNPKSVLAWAVVALLFLAAAVAAFWWAGQAGIPVTVTVDGHNETVRTNQPDVGRLLADLGLTLRPEDRVQPAPETPLVPGLAVTVQRARPGLIVADGIIRQTYSHATTVGALLTDAGVRLGPADELWLDGAQVTPDTLLPQPTQEHSSPRYHRGRAWAGHAPLPVRLTVHRGVPITVDDGSVPYTIFTTASTVGEALLREELTLYLGDRVQPSLGSRVHAGMRVVIERSTPVLITADGRTVRTRTRGKTVGDTLTELGITVAGSDRVEPSLASPVFDHLPIRVVRVLETSIVESRIIPFESIMVPDDQLEIDHQRLVQGGANGEFRQRFRVVYEDGVEVVRALTDAWTAAPPVTRTVAYGRKIISRQLETPDGTISYWRKVRMYATSYSPARSGTPRSAPWYGRTRLGWTLRKGIAAVDPSVIPLQTRLYVPGYGFAAAGDTGGGVRGRWIDLGYEDHDYVSWHWWVDVYVLDPPPPPTKIRWVLPNWPLFRDRGR